MKVMVIGGTGHVGTFMIPQLIEAGMDVVVVGSGKTPLPKDKVWQKVKYLVCDVSSHCELDKLADESPDVVVDMTGEVWNIYQKLKSVSKHVIACGSVWMFGEAKVVPMPEETQNPCPFEDYQKRYSEILNLVKLSRKDGVAFTAIMPPNICGPGKIPIDCLGGRSLDLHRDHARGKEVILPDGPDALIGPCDAQDIADCFVKAVLNRDKSAHQIFNVGSAYALTAAELVGAYSEIYNVKIPIKRIGWNEYVANVSPDIGYWWHFKAHMCPDISKAKKLLGYQPQFTPEQTIRRAVEWMKINKML
ncbi:MAG: NAD(P)-dependent oxidoreductase [Phycisphaerae bacterium]|jgi:nucleoside-diphosphate-sugar epimerase